MVLHLTTVLLFQQHTGCILHVPGKLVPMVIKFLESRVSSEEYSTVIQFQKLVTAQWKASGGNKPSTFEVTEDLAAEPSPAGVCSVESLDNIETDNKGSSSHVTSADVDQQLRDLIGILKGLVIKPRKSTVPEL